MMDPPHHLLLTLSIYRHVLCRFTFFERDFVSLLWKIEYVERSAMVLPDAASAISPPLPTSRYLVVCLRFVLWV